MLIIVVEIIVSFIKNLKLIFDQHPELPFKNLFRSSDSNWIFVSGCVTGILLIFSFFELWAVVKIFLAKPICLNPSQSKLLGAKGIDFEVKKSKPKPNVLNTRDMETSLSSCLLNRSLDSPKNGQPLKKSNAQSPTILRNRRLVRDTNQYIAEQYIAAIY